MEVTEQATQRFNDAVAEALGPTVWNTGCSSWYRTDGGTIDLWPFDRDTLTSMLTEPDDQNYQLTGTRQRARDADPSAFRRQGDGADLQSAEIRRALVPALPITDHDDSVPGKKVHVSTVGCRLNGITPDQDQLAALDSRVALQEHDAAR